MKVNSKEKAWEEANKLFPTDYEKDEASSIRAGYDIYRHPSLNYYSRICDLRERLEVLTGEYGENVTNIWIISDEFDVEVISRGSYLDNSTGDGKTWKIEVITLRMNHIALNKWLLSECLNCRDCYSTDEEWQAHRAEKKAEREAWAAEITNILKIGEAGGVSITQSQSEIFTLVHIYEI